MTVPVNDRRIQYTATASQTIFPYDFRIEVNASITILQTIKLTGVTNTLVLTTDYTVSNVAVDGGGNITLVTGAAVDDTITITGATPLSRTTDFSQAGDFLASDLNAQLDSTMRILQENETETARALVLAAEDTATSLTLPLTADRASNFLAFDASGDPIAAAGTTEVSVSAFMATVLDDTTAAAARTTLDAEQKANSLTAITTLQDADQFIVADNSDSDNSKKITLANLKNEVRSVIQVVTAQTSAVATGTTTMPFDDTIPQNTEGVEVITQAITPINTSSRLLFQGNIMLAHSASASNMTIALFQDSTADALGATTKLHGSANEMAIVPFLFEMAAGTISETTFKIRIGTQAAGTLTINGQGGVRRNGGVAISLLTITEIKV